MKEEEEAAIKDISRLRHLLWDEHIHSLDSSGNSSDSGDSEENFEDFFKAEQEKMNNYMLRKDAWVRGMETKSCDSNSGSKDSNNFISVPLDNNQDEEKTEVEEISTCLNAENTEKIEDFIQSFDSTDDVPIH